jgi:hypothetical protein
MRVGVWMGLVAAAALAGSASAETVISGRSAQALRCAAYVGLAGQLGYAAGLYTAAERARMAEWSLVVVDRWVPLDAQGKFVAYWTALEEVTASGGTARLLARHGDWCVREFDRDPRPDPFPSETYGR